MKTRSIIFLLATFLSLGVAAESVRLWSADDCLGGKVSACSYDETFVRDQHLRCGCLKDWEYVDIRLCMENKPECGKNEVFSLLKGASCYIGCGCYETR